MQSVGRSVPPHIPIRPSRWPVRRMPRWVILAMAVFIAGAVLVALVHRPSQAQRAADLRGFLSDMSTDIESCAGGVSESLTALHDIESGASHDMATALDIARYGAKNCSPANNMQLGDLSTYQVTESLASYHLASVVTGLITWAAPDAMNVQTDVAAVLSAQGAQARNQAQAKLRRDLVTLDNQRASVDRRIQSVISSLAAHAAPPNLPG